MKRVLAILVALCAIVCVNAQSSQGDMAVGLNLGVGPNLESGPRIINFGLGGKFQYTVVDKIRLEADVDYWFKSKGVDLLDIMANAHYLFDIGGNFYMYPIAGIGYGHITGGLNRFLFDVGLGAEYGFNDHFSVDLEVKYQYVKNLQRMPIQIGVNYKF